MTAASKEGIDRFTRSRDTRTGDTGPCAPAAIGEFVAIGLVELLYLVRKRTTGWRGDLEIRLGHRDQGIAADEP